MESPEILLVNPPIFDFTAYDFWLRPYGMLRVAGMMSHTARLTLFDYLVSDRRDSTEQELNSSIRFAHETGTRVLLAEFSPIPGTADGERCREWADLEEPLAHNKTAFTIRRLGTERVNQLKTLTRDLNSAGPYSL